MYASIYVHIVPQQRLDEVMAILEEAAEVYNEFGALGCRVYQSEHLEPRYGCAAFTDGLAVGEGEVVLVELNVFEGREHHETTMIRIDADDRIEALYQRLRGIVDVGRTRRGEFSVVL